MRNDANSLIFFAYWDRGRLPAVGREEPPYRGETKHPIFKNALVTCA